MVEKVLDALAAERAVDLPAFEDSDALQRAIFDAWPRATRTAMVRYQIPEDDHVVQPDSSRVGTR